MGVHKTSVSGSGDITFPRRFQFFRCATNNTNHSKLSMMEDENLQVVIVSYLAHGKDGPRRLVILTHNRTQFFEAFDEKTKKVKASFRVLFGGVKHDQRPTIMPSLLYAIRYCDNVSEHAMKSVLTAHANGLPMMTFLAYCRASWCFYHDGAELRQTFNWGITERMQQIRLSPSQNAILTSGNLIMNEEAKCYKGSIFCIP